MCQNDQILAQIKEENWRYWMIPWRVLYQAPSPTSFLTSFNVTAMYWLSTDRMYDDLSLIPAFKPMSMQMQMFHYIAAGIPHHQ